MLTTEVHRIRASSLSQGGAPAGHDIDGERGSDDEIASLQLAFHQLAKRIADQWRDLQEQDQQRRDLVANISHDLRTPLASMHGYLETLRLKADHPSESERLHYLDVAIDQSKKVSRLARELFELARLEEGSVKLDKEPFSMVDLVQDVFQKFELAVEAKQQRLIPDIELDLPIVRGDFGMIERVLTNLLDNALRHSPIGGEIKVKLRCDGGSVRVQVSDSGPGIPDDVRQTMFTRPSFRSDPHNFARGLGLVIVRRILLLHKSDISVFPSQAYGATFEFALEAANRTASARA
jgi:signal transduction histidine kinase